MADYCTIAEVKNMMPDVEWASDYDATILSLISRASRAIDRWTGREPDAYCAPEATRLFDGAGNSELYIGELAAAPTEVKVAWDGTTFELLDAAEYYCLPTNSLPFNYIRLELGTFPCKRRSVQVKGKFGYSLSVPDDIKQAVIIQVIRWYKHGQQAFQNTAASNEFGTPQYVRLDETVSSILEAYRKVVI